MLLAGNTSCEWTTRPGVSMVTSTLVWGNNSIGDTAGTLAVGLSSQPEVADPDSIFSLLDTMNRLGSGVTVAGDAVEADVSGDFLRGLFPPRAGGGVASWVKALLREPAAKAADKASDWA